MKRPAPLTPLLPLAVLVLLALSTPAHALDWDYEEESYGSDHSLQWLNIKLAEGDGPRPVHLFAHANGGDAYDESAADVVAYGYTLVSWASVDPDGDPDEARQGMDDAQLVLDWVRANAEAFNLDPDHIIVGGRSRGSFLSWHLAHSGDPGIRGAYFYNALPDGVWGESDEAGLVDAVGLQSPPMFLAFGPEPNDGDGHNPANLYPVLDVYEDMGRADEVWLEDSMTVAELRPWHYFPNFIAALEEVEEVNGPESELEDDVDDRGTAKGSGGCSITGSLGDFGAGGALLGTMLLGWRRREQTGSGSAG